MAALEFGVRELAPALPSGGVVITAGTTASATAKTAPASTIYLGQDGTGVPMRPEALVNRPGKQADGNAKTCSTNRSPPSTTRRAISPIGSGASTPSATNRA